MHRAFWLAVRGNLEKVSDAATWWSIVSDGPSADERVDSADTDFVRQAFDALPEGEFGPQTWKEWTLRVKEASGRSGKSLFMPLRLALTGRSSGPELAQLLPVLGRERTLARRP